MSSTPRRLVLASASSGRLGLLRAAGIEPEVRVSGVSEDGFDPARPDVMVAGLARRKAEAVAAEDRSGALVLGCDSVLEVDGRAHGKPVDGEEATARWLAMRGRAGILHTGHCLIAPGFINPSQQPEQPGRVEGVASTVVRFAPVTDAEIAAYVASGEPFGVAGAFTLDGRSAPFIDRIDGDPSTVIGLSLPLLRTLLGRLGLTVMDLWS